MRRLARAKGYRFVGTGSAGVNAFFVREDLAGPILDAIGEVRAWPSRHRDSRDAEGRFTHARGAARADLISGMPVVDLGTGQTRTIASLGDLYGEAWAREL